MVRWTRKIPLTNIRLLRNLRPPVSVYFDKERLDSLDEKAEVFLTMLASFAQEESRSISTNIKWATRSRMKAGTQKTSTTSLLGYDTDDDGEMVIITNEAEIVRTIYMSFDKGMHPAEIAEKLNALEIRTKDMTERKTKMIELGDAFIAFPGGTGTLEEIAEVMSKVSLKHLDAPCILYDLDGYYTGLRMLLGHMIETGLSSEERQKGIYFAKDLAEIKAILNR